MGRVRAGSDIFRAVADPTRRRLVDLLSGGPRAAGDLRASFAISQPALSQHLKVLRDAGLVTRQATGRHLYVLNRGPLRPLFDWAAPHTPTGLRGDPPVAGTASDAFIGRQRELDELATLLGSCRLVTLTGPSGVGKTRLAAELVARTAGSYPGGAWSLDLAPVGDPTMVIPAVAAVLSVREPAGATLAENLVASLRDRRLLLVLDGCEQVLAACAELSDLLLGSCTGVTMLVTSQAPLGTEAERAWPVPSLVVPDPREPVDTVAAADAVLLFCRRAASVRGDFQLTSANAPLIAEICRRLDGIPLAIELAAARVGVITLPEIASRLDDRFALLAAATETKEGRHQTLEGALDWSHHLLPAQERALLRRMSVFVGGCSLTAVQAVCGEGAASVDDLLDPLAALVIKSLVVADTDGDVARYRMLETIRLYAADRLDEAGETDRTRARHARWCLELAELAEPALTGPDQREWLERIGAEHDNLRWAQAWATATGDADTALRIAGALSLFWRVRGHFREGRRRLESALALDGATTSNARAKALRGLGLLAIMLTDTASAIPHLEEALALDRERGDVQAQARALLLLGNARSLEGRSGAPELYEQSITLARDVDDTWCLGHALGLLAWVRLSNPEAGARALLEECLSVARGGGELQSLRIGLYIAGNRALAEGDYRGAEALLTEGLEVTRQLSEPFDIGVALQSLGDLSAARGDDVAALPLYRESLSFGRQTGSPLAIASALCGMAAVALRTEGPAAARPFLDEAATAAGDDGRWNIPVLQGRAAVAIAESDANGARTLLQLIHDLARTRGDRRAMASALSDLAELSRQAGTQGAAAEQHHEGLRLRAEINDPPGVADSLEGVAGLATDAGRWEDAARMLGAAQALRDREGYARAPCRRPGHEANVTAVEAGLGPGAFAAAWEQGATMSLAEAIAYARKRRGAQTRPREGWASLTRAERGVATLVADGLTNAQIGARLFIATSTVEGHLSHIFGKLGLDSRTQLVRETVRNEPGSGAPKSIE